MAKEHSNIKALSQLVAVSSVAWLRDLNVARSSGDYGKLDALIESFALSGWQQTGDGTIDVEPLPATVKERVNNERQDKWDTLKGLSKVDQSKLLELSVFEELYTDGKGKLKPILYLGVSGNRRSEAFFPGMVARRKASKPEAPLALTTEIPVVIKEYASAADRLADQIRENEHKSLGFLEMSAIDKLVAAKKLVELGAIQADLRKTFKDGTGQKMWGVIQLDAKYPDVKIIDRMMRKPEADGYIHLPGVKFSDLPKLVQQSNPTELEKLNKERLVKGDGPLPLLTSEKLEQYFTAERTDGNAKKIMKRENLEGLSNNFPALPIRAMATAILKDNVDGLKAYQAHAVGFNALDTLINEGAGGVVEQILAKFVQVPREKRAELFAKVVELAS